MSLRSGVKYAASTDTHQPPTSSERINKFVDTSFQLQTRLQSHILTRRYDNSELLSFAVNVKRKCLENMTNNTTELQNQLQQQSRVPLLKPLCGILKPSSVKREIQQQPSHRSISCSSSQFSFDELDSDTCTSKLRKRDQKKLEKTKYVSVNGDARSMFLTCDYHYLQHIDTHPARGTTLPKIVDIDPSEGGSGGEMKMETSSVVELGNSPTVINQHKQSPTRLSEARSVTSRRDPSPPKSQSKLSRAPKRRL